MDNLEQLWCQSVRINEEEYGRGVCFSSSEEFACFISDTNYVCIYEHNNPTRLTRKKIEDKELKHISYLAVHDAIFLATDYELILFDRHSLQINVCYKWKDKIVALAWNPAETAIVVIDDAGKIILCNFSTLKFESEYSTHLNVEVPSSIYVGWGSEKTQFQGPRIRQQKVKEKAPVPPMEMKYKPPKISWRGNGQLFAINFYKNGQRFIKVFDNQLQPLNVSSEYPNLMEPITFMVAGQCVAGTAVGDVNIVIIFEKNCKVKSTFEVPENKGTIVKMQFHAQMNMLAVYSLDVKECGYLNIYLNANGIWILKQQLYFPPTKIVQDFEWINLHEPLYTICRLVIFSAKSIEYYNFRFIINKCPGSSIVAVVDGTNISWYNFAAKIIPPPIANSVLVHSSPINRILFHPQKLLCVVLDSTLQVMVIDLNNFSKLLSLENSDLRDSLVFHSVIWNESTNIQINIEGCSEKILRVQESGNLKLQISTINRKNNSKFALLYADTDCLTSHIDLDMESRTIYVTKRLLSIMNSEIELDFALSSNRELYLNEQVVCNGVTSFNIFQDYLLLTTLSCRLYCARLSQDYNVLLQGKLDLEKLYSREIEQGARIVTVSKGHPPQITMILPRGNLETIRCRLLTIDMIEGLLSKNMWKTAVNIMRIERMNWNLLIDLNPERFSEHIQDFVKAAEFSTTLSTIVNDFTNKPSFYKNCFTKFPENKCDKKQIIRKIINYLTSKDLISNLLSIVSIQEKHFSLKSALNYLKIVFELNPRSNESICKTVLQLLSNKRYFRDILDATYSLHSLDFLIFVYHNSSEDPRIYEPEIAEFRNLEPVELRFKMSLKANNPKDAVKYLLRCDNYDKSFVEAFILRHQLEDVAYKCLPTFYKHFEMVSIVFAKRLSLKHKHNEAAFILKRANLNLQALEEYKEALDWREVLNIFAILKCNQDEQRKVLYDLSYKLSRAHRVDEGVLLLDKYCSDYKKAVWLLIEHKAFRKAICLAKEHHAKEVLEELLVPALRSHMLDLKEKIHDFEIIFDKYFNRLQLLRKQKKIKLTNLALGIYEGGDDDLYSETESMVSSYGSSRATSRSRASHLSSKNRRKEARKKIDLREGGYYEDIALIRALHILYSDVFTLGTDVMEVCLILDHDDLQLARSLHESLSCLQDKMKNNIPVIWCDVFVNVPQVLDSTVLAIVENKADLDPAYCVPPGDDILLKPWKLEMFT